MENEKENPANPDNILRDAELAKTGRPGTHLGRRPGFATNSPNYTPDPEIMPEDREEGFEDKRLKDQPNAEPPDPLTLSDEEMLTEPG